MIRIPADHPQPPPQVFSLATPHHVLGKLHWEMENLQEHLRSSKNELFGHLHASYMAFNFAVTAWHLCDWIWHSWAKEEQKQVMANLDPKVQATSGNFLGTMSQRCRELRICQQIANGSKHMKYERADDTIKAALKWKYIAREARNSRGEELPGSFVYSLLVVDNDRQRDAIEVFQTVLQFWNQQLAEWGFIEDTIVLPDDDDGAEGHFQ